MTICIAATCNRSRDSGPKIILCTDWRVSSQLGDADILHKQSWLPHHWWCLTAGDPLEINAIVPVIRQKFNTVTELNETNAKPLIQEALYERRSEKRNAITQERFGMDYSRVLEVGKDKLPKDHFLRCLADCGAVRIDAEFIVAGFVGDDDFIIETTKRCETLMPTDFACVGEGEYLAQASLTHRAYSHIAALSRALYFIYEAKRAAQRVRSVSPLTLIKVLSPDGNARSMKLDKMTYLDALYEEYGPKLVPQMLEDPDPELFW